MVNTASDQDVMATEPVMRRVIAARISDAEDVDDLVHDGLERLLKARHRLAPEAMIPYAVVVAQNLVTSRARQYAQRTKHPTPFALPDGVPGPEEAVLVTESQKALHRALAQLEPDERDELVAYQEHRGGHDSTEPSPAALRVRMARSRGKLRVEYLLALRRAELPTPTCHRVLLAISSGDVRRQNALKVGDHLLCCDTCADLSEPLSRRSLGLTAASLPFGFVGKILKHVRAHPASSTVATGAAVGATALAIALAAGGLPVKPSGHRAPLAHPSATSTTTQPANSASVPGLSVQGSPLRTNGSLAASAGSGVVATSVLVQSVDTHDGFWIGTSTAERVWVELVGPLRQLQIVAGDRLDFTGTVVAQEGKYPAAVGVSSAEGAGQLQMQGAHIEVPTPDVTVTSTP
jgi:RNA polymerase sigma factor (sigma-70 family)